MKAIFRLIARCLLVGTFAGGLAGSASAATADAGNGRAFAKTYCSRCHAIGRVGASPVAQAPAFRDLHLRYDIEDLPDVLSDGVRTGHSQMPEWLLDASDSADLSKYVLGIQSQSQ